MIEHHGATIDIPLREGRGTGLAKPLKLINTPVRESTLGAWYVTCEACEAFDRGFGFAAVVGDPGDVEDDPTVYVFVARGDDHELRTPGGLAVALEMEFGVRLEQRGSDLAGVAVDARVAGWCFVQGGDDFAVGVQHP